MLQEDIERIAKLVGYATFLAIYLSWKKMGRYVLKNDPDNLILPLYFMPRVKFWWKFIYVSIGAVAFIILIIEDVYTPFAVLFSMAFSIYLGTFIARKSNRTVWKDNDKPQLENTQ